MNDNESNCLGCDFPFSNYFLVKGMCESCRIQAAIKLFPATFGLRAFPGRVFRCSPSSSYITCWGEKGIVMLYTQRLESRQVKSGPSCGQYQDEWIDFAKGTVEELKGTINFKLNTYL